MSSEASNRTGVASKIRPSMSVTRIASASAPADDMGVGHDVAVGDDEPGPDRADAARPGRDLDRAGLGVGGDGPGLRIVGSVHLGRRQGFEADEDVRQPGRIEQVAELAGHLRDGRQDRRSGPGRSSTMPASSASRGTGPSAAMLPTSQMTSSAWAIPKIVPPTRSAALRTPVPRARAMRRPSADPTVSPRPTASSSPVRTRNGRRVGSTSRRNVLEPGQRQDGEHAAERPRR